MRIFMNKAKLLEILKENRQKHIDEFAMQIQGWKKAVELYNEEVKVWSLGISEDIFSKEKEETRPTMPFKPSSHIEDYDKYIELLEHHETGLIGLEEYEFSQIVKNEFNWSRGFILQSSTYNHIAE